MADLKTIDIKSLNKKIDDLTTKIDEIIEEKEEINDKKDLDESDNSKEEKEEIKEEVETKTDKVSQFTKDKFITSDVESLLNERIKLEYNNAQAYHSLSITADRKGMFGLKALFHKQAHDEHEHATRLKEYVTDMGGIVIVPKVDEMNLEIDDIADALSKALDLEIETTTQYSILYKELFEKCDFLTLEFISWFLSEQREELTLFRNLIDRWNSIGKSNPLVFDSELKSYV